VFHINVWLTVKDPQDVPWVRDHLARAAKLSRTEPGCVRFEVFHSEGDTRRFLLCERWESKAAWETHRTAEAFTTIYQPHVLPRVDRDPHISQLVE
jgi:quinol monooxygenase YgiN